MQEENEIIPGSPNDPDNPARVLAKLGNETKKVANNIIYIPWERVKFVCKNHKIIMTINMSDSNQRDKNNKMEEYECSCGTIYIRTRDQRKLQSQLAK